jgi:hypothetical protein
MNEVHHSPLGGQFPPASVAGAPPALDFGDLEALDRWLLDMTIHIRDATGAGEDATRPPGERDLGRRAARRIIVDADLALYQLLDVAKRGREAMLYLRQG